MKNLIRALVISPLLFAAQWSYAQCDVNDFWIGAGTVVANSCMTSAAQNNQVEGVLETWLAPVDLGLLAKYEQDEGVEAVEGFASVLSINPEGGGEFSWTLTPSAFVNDAVFLVKQASANSNNQDFAWVAYSFGDILVDFGGFFTDIFNSQNYSHVSLYGSSTSHVSVPEIDGKSAGIALALVFGLIALIRERRGRLMAVAAHH